MTAEPIDDFHIPPEVLQSAVTRESDFWQSRPILKMLHDQAQARRAGPWAVLGVSLARAVAATEPTVKLPAIVGGKASLNLFIAAVGASGSGKGAAEAAARDLTSFSTCGGTGSAIEIPTRPLGSGEGISKFFCPPPPPRRRDGEVDEPEPAPTRVLFTVPEVDTLVSLGSRTGSTVMAELRKVYSGETLGFLNSDSTRTNIVEAHTYRATMVVGVQPKRAAPILDDADGGTPQRYLWLPVADPTAPEVRPQQEADIPAVTLGWFKQDETVLEVPLVAVEAIDNHRLLVLRGDPDVDPLDGHRMMTQLKVAAALMLLEGRTVVSEEDWQLAAVVMAKSQATREAVTASLAVEKREQNRARAVAEAERAKTVEGRKENDDRRRVRNAVLRKLERLGGEPASRADLRSNLKGDIRYLLDEELAALIEGGVVRSESSSGPRGTRFFLA